MRPHRDTFREYLESLPEGLLQCVAADYAWLRWVFRDAPQGAEFRRRSEACRDECVRRGLPEIYREAEETIHLQPA
jgi:hypothetical protein